MPNVLKTIAPGELIARRILDTLLEEYPFLRFIAADYSDEQAEFGRAIKIQTPGAFTAGTWTRANGYAASDAAQSELSLTIDQHPYVTYSFDDQERSSASIPLIERFAQAGAHAIGKAMVDQIIALVTAANFTNATTQAISGFNRASVINGGIALNARKVPSVGRVLLLNSTAYGNLLGDAVLVANPGSASDAVRSGELGNVHGFRAFEFPQLPNTGNLYGIALAPGALLMATRLPTLPEPSGFNGMLRTVAEEKSGLSIQMRQWYDPLKGLEYRTYTLMFGVAKGDASRLQRFISA